MPGHDDWRCSGSSRYQSLANFLAATSVLGFPLQSNVGPIFTIHSTKHDCYWLNKLMQNIRKKLSQADIKDLGSFLISPQRPDGTLCFQELQGFLFAVASSPEMVQPSDWLAIISNDEDIGFKDQSEAQRILSLIMTLHNQVNSGVLERSDRMPSGCEFQTDNDANFDEEVAVSQWSRGFMLGHDWLADIWDENVPELLDGECGSSAMVLSFFGSRQLAEAYHAEMSTPRYRRPGMSFSEFAEVVRELFPAALSSYAHLGRTISEVIAGPAGPNH